MDLKLTKLSTKFRVTMVFGVLGIIAYILHLAFKTPDIYALAALYGFLGTILKFYNNANLKEHEINGGKPGGSK